MAISNIGPRPVTDIIGVIDLESGIQDGGRYYVMMYASIHGLS